MATDPKRIQAIFLQAAETEDSARRAAILDRECAVEPELRQRVEELLRAPPASSAATVALEPSTDPQASSKTSSITSAGLNGDDEESRLDFLQVSTKPGSIGRLGHYEILQVIGKGGFGTVLRAFDEKLHRVVAIKVLSPELAASATARNRFIREARAAAAVTHDHVVTIHVVDEDHRPPYLVMQLIDGVTLQQKLDKVGALSLKEILRIGMQMAEGLAAAHKQGLVHRDIKPANILLENGIERVKITDFGLARAVDDASVTQSGTVAGTPLYMSPEQANGLTLDHRSDLFSLGTVLYVMCTGRPPFRASGTMAVLKRVSDDVPRSVREINPEVPDWLEAIIAKLHAKKPEDRFQTAKEVAELLNEKLAALQSTGRADGSNAPTTMPAPKPAHVSSHPKARVAVPPQPRVRTSVLVLIIATLVMVPCVIVPGGLAFYFIGREFGPEQRKEVIPHKDDNLIVKLDDPVLRVSVLAENGDEHLFPGDHPREGRFDLKPGRYQIQAIKNDVLVFQEWVTLGGEPKTIQVNSGWVQLFNGKDLTGWKTHPEQPGIWNVEEGELVGSTGGEWLSHLYTERGDFTDFHLRAEVKINKNGDSGIHFHCTPSPEYDLGPLKGRGKQPLGYEANISNSSVPTIGGAGSIWWLGAQGKVFHKPGKDVPIEADIWFQLEIVMTGNHIVTKVNGKTVVDFRDAESSPAKGHFALQAYYAPTKVHFKKIEMKELPPSGPPLAIAPFDAAKAKEHQDAWAKHLSVEPEITNSIGMKLRLIPPGEFLMGTPANDLLALLEKARKTKALDLEITRIAKEGTQHPVRLTQPYYIGTFEVTRAQFARFVQATGYKTDIERNGKGGWSNHKGEWVRRPEHVWSTPGEWQTHDDEPVVQVTWNDAKTFCDWLSETEGRSYVLPTEAQWEFACRAGTTDLTHAEPGRPLKEYAWTSETLLPDRATHHPKPVGLKKKNAFGLHDMLGNAWEHCSDWYEPGPTKPDLRIDPVGPKTGSARSIRGGAWYREGSIFARCGGRSHGLVFGMDSEGSDAGIGFRVAIVGDLKARTKPATSWVPFFNGKDLTGWPTELPDKWRVENGAIIGQGNSYLSLTDKKFENFHCRLEAKINADGWGGLAIRNTGESHANVSICPERGKTGSLFFFNNGMNQLLQQPEKQLASPDTWLTLEVIVQGKNVVVLVNGTQTAEASIDGLPDRGRILLNADAPGTVIHFRKIEIKELPATPK